MAEAALKHISAEEYFAMEETAFEKSEYYHGEIFAMSGASIHHNLIVANTIIAVGNALKDSCFVFPSDIKVELDPGHHYAYPDISLVCGDIAFGQGRNDIITNPKVIIEVLSESTRNYDRGNKFAAYRQIQSLSDYILIDQYRVLAEHFTCKSRDNWELKICRSAKDILVLDSVGISLALKDVYKNIPLETEDTE
ncbi:MAG: Uma2 family endonuclease [Desulfococcaceae bacterium]|jgi:Uma2 family endonuclease|nr:Uma2 family endonuclease [Desulfococcaceae bacterium]